MKSPFKKNPARAEEKQAHKAFQKLIDESTPKNLSGKSVAELQDLQNRLDPAKNKVAAQYTAKVKKRGRYGVAWIAFGVGSALAFPFVGVAAGLTGAAAHLLGYTCIAGETAGMLKGGDALSFKRASTEYKQTLKNIADEMEKAVAREKDIADKIAEVSHLLGTKAGADVAKIFNPKGNTADNEEKPAQTGKPQTLNEKRRRLGK